MHVFWYRDPRVLLNTSPIPKSGTTLENKVNSLALLVILITIVLYLIGYNLWYVFLIIGLGFTVLISISDNNEEKIIETLVCQQYPKNPQYPQNPQKEKQVTYKPCMRL